MGQLYLVRHGQANSSASSEEDYDRLSDLGHRQANLLGEWVRDHETPFDLTISGTMRRHRETAIGMGFTPESEDERLNELGYFALVRDMQAKFSLKPPVSSEDFAKHMPQTLVAWEQEHIDGDEPFATFQTRILAALAEAAKPGKRVLCVTSGGVISMVMRATLGLSAEQMARVMLPVFNSSLHKFHIRPEGTALMSFNTIPHLDRPELADHRTHF
ncbi:histidine phosphatase family protein [Octadecabacter sp.]|nr:histidine phosphatase family protein [Octadecabacter sp.]